MSQTKIKIYGLFRPCDADFINEAMPRIRWFCLLPQEPSRRDRGAGKSTPGKMRPSIPAVGVFVNEVQSRITRCITLEPFKSSSSTAQNQKSTSALRTLPMAEIWKAFPVAVQMT